MSRPITFLTCRCNVVVGTVGRVWTACGVFCHLLSLSILFYFYCSSLICCAIFIMTIHYCLSLNSYLTTMKSFYFILFFFTSSLSFPSYFSSPFCPSCSSYMSCSYPNPFLVNNQSRSTWWSFSSALGYSWLLIFAISTVSEWRTGGPRAIRRNLNIWGLWLTIGRHVWIIFLLMGRLFSDLSKITRLFFVAVTCSPNRTSITYGPYATLGSTQPQLEFSSALHCVFPIVTFLLFLYDAYWFIFVFVLPPRLSERFSLIRDAILFCSNNPIHPFFLIKQLFIIYISFSFNL